MGSHGIKDRVAIVGMGCTRFAEHWDKGLDDLLLDATGTIATFTVDRLAYSPSPPVVFAVVDFDGGGRLPVELTFRKLFTADGIHNYFWKARIIDG